jgi:hypothetical protein
MPCSECCLVASCRVNIDRRDFIGERGTLRCDHFEVTRDAALITRD